MCADLLLHVIDVTDEQRYAHMEQVNDVIEKIGAASVPQILVFNKIDAAQEQAVRVERVNGGLPRVWLSARTGEGVAELLEVITEYLNAAKRTYELHLPPGAGKFRASLFQQGAVRDEYPREQGGWIMHICLDTPLLHRLCHDHGMDLSTIQ